MAKEAGVFSFSAEEAAEEILKYRQDGWRIFELPKGISSRGAFFEGVRSTLPLDPPLLGNQNWDALADSLWSGLDALTDDMILIVWPDSSDMTKNASDDAEIAINILSELPTSLGNDDITAGNTKKVAIIRLI
ncbi:barstar family protein [Allosphingosinicella deserti]|nr:barstar family protein [Sphingomonas deserti]